MIYDATDYDALVKEFTESLINRIAKVIFDSACGGKKSKGKKKGGKGGR